MGKPRKLLARLWYDMTDPQLPWTIKTLTTQLNLATPEIKTWRKDMAATCGYVEGVVSVEWLVPFLLTERAARLPGLRLCSVPRYGAPIPDESKLPPTMVGTWTDVIVTLNTALQSPEPFALSYGLQSIEADAERKDLWAKLDVRLEDLVREKKLGARGANKLMNIYGSKQLTTLLLVGEVVTLTLAELKERKAYGGRSLRELLDYLESVGLKPGMKPDELKGWYARRARIGVFRRL